MSKIKTVKLYMGEIVMAQAAGMLRRNECIRNGTQSSGNTNKYHAGEVLWDTDIEGAGAEEAFCKHKNIFWNGAVNTFKEADIIGNVQIRHTVLDWGKLIVRKREGENLDDYYVLVVGRMPNYKVVGFLKGREAAQDKWWINPNNKEWAWFVPQQDLKDVDLLDCHNHMAVEIKEACSPSIVVETLATEKDDFAFMYEEVKK
jgi:hypothetical protein